MQFEILPAGDGKTNVYYVTSITRRAENVFVFLEELQSVSLHKKFMRTTAYNKVGNTFKRRHRTRKVWITTTNA